MSCKLEVKVIPNAPKNEFVDWMGEVLKVKIHAPALEGRANEALCGFLADTLGVPRRTLSVARGDKSRQKLIAIEGMTLAEAKARLASE